MSDLASAGDDVCAAGRFVEAASLVHESRDLLDWDDAANALIPLSRHRLRCHGATDGAYHEPWEVALECRPP